MANEATPQATIDLKGKRGKAHRPKSSSYSNHSLSPHAKKEESLEHQHQPPRRGEEKKHRVSIIDIEDDDCDGSYNRNNNKDTNERHQAIHNTDSGLTSRCSEGGGSMSSGSNISLGLGSRSSQDSANGSLRKRTSSGASASSSGTTYNNGGGGKVPSIWQKLKGMLGSRSSSVGSTVSSTGSIQSATASSNGMTSPEDLFRNQGCRSVDSKEFNEDQARRRMEIIQKMVRTTDELAEKQFEAMKAQREKDKAEQEERQKKLLELRKLQAVKGILDGTEHERRMYALQYYFDQDNKHQGFLMTSFCKLLLRHPKTRPLLKEYIQQQKSNLGLTSAMDRDDVVKVIAQKWMKNSRIESKNIDHLEQELEKRIQKKGGSKKSKKSKSETRDHVKIENETASDTKSESETKKSKKKEDSDIESETKVTVNADQTQPPQQQQEEGEEKTEEKVEITEPTKPKEKDKSALEKILLEQKIKARLNKRLKKRDSRPVIASETTAAATEEETGDTQAKVAGYPRSEEMLRDEGRDMQGTITKSGAIQDQNLAKYVKSLEDVVDEKLKTIIMDEVTPGGGGGGGGATSENNGKMSERAQAEYYLI